MPTIAQLPQATTAPAATDEIPIMQNGTTRGISVGEFLANTQPALIAPTGSLFGRVSLGPGGPETVAPGLGLAMQGSSLIANGADHSSYAISPSLNLTDNAILDSAGTPKRLPLVDLRGLFSAGGDVHIDANGVISTSIASNPLVAGALQTSGGTMTGSLVLAADPTQSTQASTKNYVDTSVAGLRAITQPALSAPQGSIWGRVSASSGGPEAMTLGAGLALQGAVLAANGGDHAGFAQRSSLTLTDEVILNASGTPMQMPVSTLRGLFSAAGDITLSSSGVVSTSIASNPLVAGALQTSGGTMTGSLVLAADPTQARQASTKNYVDTAIATVIPNSLKAVPGGVATLDTNGHLIASQLALANADASNATALASGASTARALASRFADTASVLDFGVLANGTDQTANFQAAVNAMAGKTLRIPQNTTIIIGGTGAITIPAPGIRIIGDGPSSVLQWASVVGGNDLLSATAANASLFLRDLTINGNQQGDQSLQVVAVRFTSAGTLAAPAVLDISNVIFRNGRFADISIGLTDTNIRFASVKDCSFYGGVDGNATFNPRFIDMDGAFDVIVQGCSFDFSPGPSSSSASGRAGVVGFAIFNTTTIPSRAVVSANRFYNVGRSVSNGTLGCIDFYNNGGDIVVTGNRLVQPWGRGINVKVDTTGATIIGNVIDGLNQGGLSSSSLGSQICLLASVTTSLGANWVIANNSVYNSNCDGITFNGTNSSGAAFAGDVAITGNVITSPGRRGITMQSGFGVNITGNVIDGGLAGIYAAEMSGSLAITGNLCRNTQGAAITATGTVGGGLAGGAQAVLQICNNTIDTPTDRGIYITLALRCLITGNLLLNTGSNAIDLANIGGSALVQGNNIVATSNIANSGGNTGLWCSGNLKSTAFAVAALTLANSSGSVTAWNSDHYVDTSTAAQTVTTIAGVPDGETITIAASVATNTLTLTSGGNLQLRASFTSSGPNVAITLRSHDGNLVEIGRNYWSPADITATLGFTPLNPANNLADLANAATARSNLGLGTMATQSAASVAISGGAVTATSGSPTFDTAIIGQNSQASGTYFWINGPSGITRECRFATQLTRRMDIYLDGNTESGSNVGSDGHLALYSDTGVFLYEVMRWTRASGLTSIYKGAAITGGTTTDTLAVTGNIGFFGHATAAKPTVTGAKGGNAALGSLLSALSGLGLLTDSSTT